MMLIKSRAAHNPTAHCRWFHIRIIFISIWSGTAYTSAATVTISSLSGSSNTGIGTIADAGQTFVCPSAPNEYLTDFRCAIGAAGGPVQVIGQLYKFDRTTTKVVGAPLYTSAVTQLPASSQDGLVDFHWDNSTALTPGQAYLFTIDQHGFGNTGNLDYDIYDGGYASGNVCQDVGSPPYAGDLWFSFSFDRTGSMGFSADFNTTPSIPEPVAPTAVLLSLTTLFRRRKK
jgi:hypothetical protein